MVRIPEEGRNKVDVHTPTLPERKLAVPPEKSEEERNDQKEHKKSEL